MKKITKIILSILLTLSVFSSASLSSYAAEPSDARPQAELGELTRKNLPVASGDNLILNSSFEDGNGTNRTNWKTTGSGSFTNYGGAAASGDWCGLLPVDTANACVYQTVKVQPNTDYVATAKILIGGNDQAAYGYFNVKTPDVSTLVNNAEVTVDWTNWAYKDVTLEFNSGQYSEIALCFMKWTDNTNSATYKAQMYVDDMTLKPKSSNLIVNGGFEDGTSDTSRSPWGTTGEGKFTNYVDAAASGEWCGLLPSNTGNASIYQIVQVEANTDYIATAQIMVGGGEGAYGYFNAKTPDISTLINDAEETVYYTNWAYKDVTLEFNTGNNTQIALCFMKWTEDSSSATYKAQMYVDNITLTKKETEEEQPKLYDEDYEILWWDNFNGSSLDLNNWGYELGCIRGVEQQHYVSDKENVYFENGNLVLKATDRAVEDQYTNPRGSRKVIYNSGSVRTHGKQEFLYGRIEMRAKLPKGQGVFPAFWTLGADFPLDGDISGKQGYGWARCGEIDIMELIGGTGGPNSDRAVWHTAHADNTYGEDNGKQAGVSTTIDEDFNNDYHIFGIDWYEDKIEWYVDNKIVYIADYSNNTISRNALNRPQYIQLNLAMGGNWPGDAGTNLAGTKFEIDYVLYGQNSIQKAQAQAYYANAPTIEGAKEITIEQGSTPDLLKDVTTTNGYFVDYSIDNEYMITNKDDTSLLCTGKDDSAKLADLEVGKYNLHYSAIPDDVVYENNHPEGANHNYKFARKTVVLNVIAAEPPVIKGKDATVEVGTKASVAEILGLSVVDNVDGDITKNVTIDTDFNPNVPGVYEVKVTATDAAGNTSTETYKITVEDKVAPVIEGKDATVEHGTIIPIKEILGLKVTDNIDGDITDKANIETDYNPFVAGTYEVKVTVTDEAGNKSEKTFTIIVEEAPDTEVPVIEGKDATVEFGTDTSVAEILGLKVTDNVDGDMTDKVIIETDYDPYVAGTYEVKVIATDAAGNTAEMIFKITVLGEEETPIPSVEPDDSTDDTPVIENTPPNDDVETGDNTSLLPYIALGTLAIAGTSVILMKKKKEETN